MEQVILVKRLIHATLHQSTDIRNVKHEFEMDYFQTNDLSKAKIRVSNMCNTDIEVYENVVVEHCFKNLNVS